MNIFILMCGGTIFVLINNIWRFDNAEISLCRHHQTPKIDKNESLINQILIKLIFERTKDTRNYIFYSKLISCIVSVLQIPWLILVYCKNLYLIRDVYICHFVICFILAIFPYTSFVLLYKLYEHKVDKTKTKR